MHTGPRCRQEELSRAVHLPPRLSPGHSGEEGLNSESAIPGTRWGLAIQVQAAESILAGDFLEAIYLRIPVPRFHPWQRLYFVGIG